MIRRFGRHSAVFAHNSRHVISPADNRHLSTTGVWGGSAPNALLFQTERRLGLSAGREPTGRADPAGRPYRAPPRDAGIPSRRQARPSQAARTIGVLIETLRVETERFVPDAEGDPRSALGSKNHILYSPEPS